MARGNRREQDYDLNDDFGLDNLLDSSVDLSNLKQPHQIDKSKVKEIMAKRKQAEERYDRVIGLNDPEPTIRGRGNENDDTMISSGVNKSSLKQSKIKDSEDDFDKLIGHIEGSRV
jgi:hypothetical protein